MINEKIEAAPLHLSMAVCPPKLLWCDVETSGLDPSADMLLEAAFLVTDQQLNVVDQASRILKVARVRWDEFHKESPSVASSHERSGLMEECLGSPWDNLDGLIEPLLERHWKETMGRTGDVILAGRNVARFDRRWIEERGGIKCAYRFSHRHFDVTGLDLLMAKEQREQMPPKAEVHRALFDLWSEVLRLQRLFLRVKA